MRFLLSIFILLNLSLSLSAYSNCEFQNKNYEGICKKVVKKGVTYKYANEFLLSYFKTKKFDEISYKYLKPKYLKQHKQNEKKANNTLVKYIPKMVKHLKKYTKVYDASEKKYGVNREIIAAILLKETHLGKIKPSHDAFIVFNTLLVRLDPNTKRNRWLINMSKTNMVSIISHCYKKGVTPKECNLPSSYAGAVGIPQFMPNSFVYADSYKNNVPDLTNMSDAIMSASKFLNKKADFNTLIDWNKMPNVKEVEEKWYEYEFKYDNASFVYAKSKRSGKKYNCFACNKPKLQYMKTYTKKIMRYNNSSNYAVGVLRLAFDAHNSLLTY